MEFLRLSSLAIPVPAWSGSTMVYGSPDDGKPQGNVNAFHRVPFLHFPVIYKPQDLKGYMALVVVHGYYDIIPAASCL